jgi:hypothetical protein
MGKYTKIKADGGPIKKVRISDKGIVKDVPINTPEYKQYYNSKTLAKATEDPNLLIAAQDLNPYEVTANKSRTGLFKEEAEKEYPISKFRNEYFPPALRPSPLDSLPQNAQDAYDKRINDLIAEKLLKSNPSFDEDYGKNRLQALGQFSPNELNILKNSNLSYKVEPSIWQKLEQGALSLNAGPVQFKNPNLTQEEAKDENHPLNLFGPLSIPYNATVGRLYSNQLGDDYSIKKALQGKSPAHENAMMSLTLDPLNYMGLGLIEGANNLARLNKVGNAIKKSNIYKNVTHPTKVGQRLLKVEREGKALGLSDFEIAQKQLKEVGITSNQRKAYTPGISEMATKYVYPFGYVGGSGGKSKVRDTFENIIKGGWEKNPDKLGFESVANQKKDAWRLYSGLPQENNTFTLANTAPINHPAYPKGSLKNMDVYNLNDDYTTKHIINPIKRRASNPMIKNNYDMLDKPITYDADNIMGGYNRLLTKDGLQYNDVWDLEPSISLKSFLPNSIKNKNYLEPFMYNKNGAQKQIKIPIHKVFGKPFMSHGNLGYTSTEHTQNLTNTLQKYHDDFINLKNSGFELQNYQKKQLLDATDNLNKLKSYPKFQYGGYINNDMNTDYAMGGKLNKLGVKNSLWNNIRANKGSGKAPTKEMLKQERKIKSKYPDGGPIKYDMYGTPMESKIQPSNVERSYYDPRTDTIYLGTDYNQMDDNQKNNLLAHENYHSMQFKGDKSTFLPTDTGIKKPAMMSTDDVYYGYHNRQPIEAQQGIDDFRQANPSFNLAPDDLIYNNVVDYSQYLDPNTLEGGAKFYGDTGQPVDEDFYGKGGYIVTRSKDRKGKTHKVTGPDGTVKYFGDSKLGQHPNDPARKKAFYARHEKNLKGNPHFRAFARKTWADGGYMDTPPNDMPLNLPLKEQNPYLVPEYNQPMANGYILPDINRPTLLPEVNASEYKSTQGTDTGDVQIPTIVGGQYIGDNGAWERYKNTGERFKPMKDPSSYSKYYDDYSKLHPKTMAMGGRMNQAQQLNQGKMRMGNSQGNSFGDYAGDIGKIMLNNIVSPIEGLTGAEIYNPDYSTEGLEKVGNFYGKMQTQAGKMLPQALNMIAPGVGTAVGAAGKAVGSGINGEQEIANMAANMKYAQGGLMHINEGGTHEQNALGGVPIGPNALVEQGETINNDFVFSDRLKPKGSKRTYAQLSKSVDTKYKLRPDDKLSKEAKQMDLDRLAMQQEAQKDEMSTKYMQKAMACGGKIKGFGGSFQGPISQSMNVTNGQTTLLPDGGYLPNYIMDDAGRVPKSIDNDLRHKDMLDYYDRQAIPTSLFGIYRDRVDELGIDKATEEYRRMVEGQQSLANGGMISNFMEPTPQYYNPADLDNQYAHGGSIHIKPENRGKFTASANRAGMGVQEFAGHVLANKEDYSSTQVKRANFARNASKWKHAMGGNMYAWGGLPDDPLPYGQVTDDPNAYDATYDITNKRPLLAAEQVDDPYDWRLINKVQYKDPTTVSDGRNVNYLAGKHYKNGKVKTYGEMYPLERIMPFDYSKAVPPILTSEDVKEPAKTNRYIDPYNQGAYNEMSQRRLPLSNPFTTLAPITNPNRITQFSPTPTELDLANYSKQIQGTNNTPAQNPYPEVGNTGYLTNLAGNLVKAGMVATSKPPIYNPSVKLNRLNPTAAERLAMQEGRREIQGTKDIIRNNATSSGQYLTNASLMGSNAANKLAGTIGGIRQQYDTQNVGIGNQEAQLNQQITAANNLAKETFRDNRLNQYNKILDSVIGANQQRFATDVHANNYQNQVLDLLKSGDYQVAFDANGKLTIVPTTK